jgi:hypothetical protein
LNIAVGIGTSVMLAVGAAAAWRAERSRPIEDWATPLRILVAGYVLLYGVGAVSLPLTDPGVGPGSLLIGGGLLAIGLGSLSASRRFQSATWLSGNPIRGQVRWWLAILLLLAGIAALASIAAARGVPLLSSDAQASRSAYGGKVFDIFRWFVPPMALLVLASAIVRPTRNGWILAAVALGLVGGIEALIASRALIFELAVGAVLIFWWHGVRPARRVWAGLAFAAVVVFAGIQLIRVNGGFQSALDLAQFTVDRTVSRVLLIGPRTVDAIVDIYPGDEPFLGGSTYLRWLAQLRSEPTDPSLGYVVFDRLFPEAPGGFAAPGVLGEGWANGGPILALALMLFLGGASQLLGRVIPRRAAGPAELTLAATLTVAILRTYATSLNGFLLTVAMAIAWYVVIAAPVETWATRLRAGFGRREAEG